MAIKGLMLAYFILRIYWMAIRGDPVYAIVPFRLTPELDVAYRP